MLLEVPEALDPAAVRRLHPGGPARPGEVLAECGAGEDRWLLRCQAPCRVEWCGPEGSPGGDDAVIGSLLPLPGQLDVDLVVLWMGAHAAVRGMQAVEGEGGLTAVRATPLPARVTESAGLAQFVEALDGVAVEDGDTVVVADKVVALAQGRVAPRALLDGADPKFLTSAGRRALAARLSAACGVPVSGRQMMLIDYLDEERVSLGGTEHNGVCAELAGALRARRGVCVDVAVVDSDTGVDRGMPLLGVPTVAASALGSTAGLTMYELFRVAAAAEIVRGHTRGAPLVRVQSAARNRARPRMGCARPYPGTLSIMLEAEIHRGLPTPAYWTKEP
jgi:hypothetical protein